MGGDSDSTASLPPLPTASRRISTLLGLLGVFRATALQRQQLRTGLSSHLDNRW